MSRRAPASTIVISALAAGAKFATEGALGQLEGLLG
jgi:hypothetical protein